MALAETLKFSFPAQVNERAARLVAGTVASTLALAWITSQWWVLPILALGFVLRAGWGPKISPLAKSAMWLAPKLWDLKPVSGPPKRFAQGIGAVVLSSATVAWLLGSAAAVHGFAGLIIVFATLEAGVAFCAGCWAYGILQRFGVFPADACVDCGPLKA